MTEPLHSEARDLRPVARASCLCPLALGLLHVPMPSVLLRGALKCEADVRVSKSPSLAPHIKFILVTHHIVPMSLFLPDG